MRREGNARDILRSAIESLRISARSRNTRHRSLSTWMRGLISRYSRTAVYSGLSVGSDSQKKLGTSSMLDAVTITLARRSRRRQLKHTHRD